MNLEKNYNFIMDYIEICRKHKMFLFYCDDCEFIHPVSDELDEEEVDEMEESLIDWFIFQRDEIALSN